MKKILTLIAVLVLCIALAGCGTKQAITMEEFMAQNPDVAESIDEQVSDLDYDGAEVSVSYKDDCCTISFEYDDTYDDDKVKHLGEAFEKNSTKVDDMANEALQAIKNGAEFEYPEIKMQFLNGDGTVIWSKEYKDRKKS